MKLEVYAARIFEEYVKQQGIDGHWDYLSSTRKLNWIKEANFLMRSSIQELSKCFKPLPKSNPQASYEAGYQHGMATERNSLLSYVEYLSQDLEQQYRQLEDKYKN
jgi:hypothetical protein